MAYLEQHKSYRAEWYEGSHRCSRLFNIAMLGKEATKAQAEAYVEKMSRKEEERIRRARRISLQTKNVGRVKDPEKIENDRDSAPRMSTRSRGLC